jgi:murein DD-endopeptidase MepM/ murein hydrolase activator NlpD
MSDNNKYHFLKKLKNKYRLVILNDGTFEERFVVRITPLLVFSVLLVISFLLVFSTFLLFSYTPLKEYVPGKTTLKTRKELIKMSSKVDSLTSAIKGSDLYVNNLRVILNGGVPISNINDNDSSEIEEVSDLNRSEKDSLFRVMVEEETNGDYISTSSDLTLYFTPPLIGVFSEKYDKLKNHFGVDITGKEGLVIKSVSEGVVVLSDWTKETGFVIAIQHSDGFLSFYKHNSKLLKNVGDFVNGGTSIAIIGNSGELTSGPHLHFELWKNGESVNPEYYITF